MNPWSPMNIFYKEQLAMAFKLIFADSKKMCIFFLIWQGSDVVEQASSTEFTENLSLLISEDYSGGDGGEPSDTVITSRLTEVQPSSTQLSAILDTTIYLSSFYHLSFIYLSRLYNLSCILYISYLSYLTYMCIYLICQYLVSSHVSICPISYL